MNLSHWAHHRQPVVITFVSLLMLLGAVSYFTLPAQEDPTITVREALVVTQSPGLSPDRVELLVTKTLEEAIRQIPEVEEIRSTSRSGQSIIHVKVYTRYFDLDPIWTKLRQKVKEVTPQLPEGTLSPRINDDFGDVAVVTAALTAEDFDLATQLNMAQHVRDKLYTVAGTKRIELHGVQDERIYIETSNRRLAQYGLSRRQVVDVLQSQNTILPGGVIDTGDRSFIVEPSGNYTSLADIEATLIPLPNGQGFVPLRDIGSVSRGPIDPPQRKAYFNGKPAIIFAVSMLEGYRVLEYAPRLKEAITATAATLPVGFSIELVTYQAEQVANAVYGVSSSVLQTLLIVLGVVVLFLGVRTGLIVGAIVPAVMLITLAVMGFMEMPLERMSLATLIIALGLLVDNGIVIAEDFKRRLEEGISREDAVSQTGRELTIPLLSSTLTTILVFLPLMLAEHQAGEYTRAISLVILISLLSSWLVAMTVTPIMCARFIKLDARGKASHFRKLEGHYAKFLQACLRHRGVFLLAVTVVTGLGAWGMVQVEKEFFPASDREQVLITLELPSDVSLTTTDTSLKKLFPMLNDKERFPYLLDYAAYAGYGGPRFVLSLSPLDAAPNVAFIVANVESYNAIQTAIEDLRVMIRQHFPELNARVTDMFLGPSDPGVIDIQVKGPDADVITRKALELEQLLRSQPGMIDVFNDWQGRVPKLQVDVDQFAARRAGVSSREVAQALTAYFSGSQISEYREGDDIYPIVFRALGSERSSIDRLESVTIQRADGSGSVPLMQVAKVTLGSDYAVIQREDLTRTVTVQGRPLAETPEDLQPRLKAALEALGENLPAGHNIEYDGIIVDSAGGKAALAANMPLCLAIVTLILIAQFNGFRRPALILITIPLTITGVALGLHIMQATFGFMVILGLLSLAGIIVNNAIVLIERIDLDRENPATSFTESIVNASARRLRPIIMTTTTTILGLMPLIISRDPLFYGMAVVIAFGLLVGTLLTLGVIPVLYSIFVKQGRFDRVS